MLSLLHREGGASTRMETELQDIRLAVYPRTRVLFQPTDHTHPHVLVRQDEHLHPRASQYVESPMASISVNLAPRQHFFRHPALGSPSQDDTPPVNRCSGACPSCLGNMVDRRGDHTYAAAAARQSCRRRARTPWRAPPWYPA